MKRSYWILSLFFIGLILFSCKKDDEPRLEIYISAEKSDLYQNVEMKLGSFRFFQDSGAGVISPLSIGGVTLNFMNGESPKLVYNESLFETEFERFGIELGQLNSTTISGEVIRVVESAQNHDIVFVYDLLPNKRYRINIVIDFDISIIIDENGSNNSFQFFPEIEFVELT